MGGQVSGFEAVSAGALVLNGSHRALSRIRDFGTGVFLTLLFGLQGCVSGGSKAKEFDAAAQSCEIGSLREAAQAVACARAKGGLEVEFLAELRSQNRELAYETLSLWMGEEAGRLRQKSGLSKRDPSLYGKASAVLNEGFDGESSFPFLLFGIFHALASDAKREISKDVLSAFLFLYSAENASGRKTLEPFVDDLLRKNEKVSVLVLREEPPVVLFRILPRMKSAAGLKNELDWLGRYHQDPRISSIAKQLVSPN